MDATAVRPVDPAELPAHVAEAVRIADEAKLSGNDRALLLPHIFNVLCARAIFPAMPTLGAGDAARLLGLGKLGG